VDDLSEWRVSRKDDGKMWIAVNNSSGAILEGANEDSLRTTVRQHCLDAAAKKLKQPVDGLAARLRRTWRVKVTATKSVDVDEDDFIGFSLFD
jgi:hypothetical protein